MNTRRPRALAFRPALFRHFFFLFFFPFFGLLENPAAAPRCFVVLAFGAARYISMSLSAVSASFVSIALPRVSPPHLAFLATSLKISPSVALALASSSTSDPADTAYAPFPRHTELRALSLVATYTTGPPPPGPRP